MREQLPILFCLLVDFPEENNDTDCEVLADGTTNQDNCFKCNKPGKYLLGEHPTEHGSAGHIVCIILWALLLVMGTFGTFANSLVIAVLRKRNKPTSFDLLLYCLATFDLLNSMASLVAGNGILFYFEKWDRGLFTLTYYYFAILLFFFGKTGSAFITVFITVERYLVIRNPIKSRNWFTPTKTKLMIAGLIFLAVLLNVPRFSSIWIRYNYNGQNVQSLDGVEYYIYSTPLEGFWYRNLKSAHYVDVFAPFPLLIIFNVLLFMKISDWVKSRAQLTNKQKSDIRAARMFVPVVAVLFLCNIVPIWYYAVIRFYDVSHRELFMGMLLSVAVNSAVNLPIYYARGCSFRAEIRNTVPKFLRPVFDKLPGKDAVEMKTVSNSGETERTFSRTESSDVDANAEEVLS